MNILYAKTLLYSYPHLLDIATQIDQLVEKKALMSLSICQPAMSQYDKIITLTFEKDVIFFIKKACDKALDKFSQDELKYFEYKYFRNKPKSYFEGFDSQSRTYFRRQVSLANKFSKFIEKYGVDEKFFCEKCLQIDFFKQLVIRTKEREAKLCRV